MGKHPKTVEIERMLNAGTDFSVNRTEYIRLTGIDIPQDPNYTTKRSAVAKLAKKYGYTIELIPEQLEFKREK